MIPTAKFSCYRVYSIVQNRTAIFFRNYHGFSHFQVVLRAKIKSMKMVDSYCVFIIMVGVQICNMQKGNPRAFL